MQRIETPSGRTITVTGVEYDWEMGRVFYAVDKVGTITLETERDRDDVEPYLYAYFGRHVSAWRSPYKHLPEEPVIYGVTCSGAWCFTVQERPETVRHRTLPRRATGHRITSSYTSEPVPDRTGRRLADITLAVAALYLDDPHRDVLEAAQAARLAPGRYVGHVSAARKARERLEAAQADLAAALAGADEQMALMTPEAAARLFDTADA